jgi:hypothetical protein
MPLEVPREPEGIKENSFLTLNKVSSYLWKSWKDELKKEGWNWKRFLKLMSSRKSDLDDYLKGEIPWEEFVKRTLELLEGPTGKMISSFE